MKSLLYHNYLLFNMIILLLLLILNELSFISSLNEHVQESTTILNKECENDDPLGMISGSIADWQITSSSTYPSSWVKGCEEKNARLFRTNGLAWCAKFKSSSEWLQIDLGVQALMTQGRGDGSEWVTSFMVSYSDDAMHWKFVTDQYANQKIFEGNSDSYSVKHNYFDEPIRARFVKIHTYTWHNHPSLRVELVGCQSCKQIIGIPPYARFAASSSRGKRSQRSCTPEYGHYLSNKAWCAQRQDALQWLQIDVGPPTLITGVILKSRGDVKNSQYVTRFKLSYSNDTRLWYFYKDAAPLDPRSTVWSFEWSQKMKESDDKIKSDKIFEGNNEQITERIHYLATPFIARYVRIHPVIWRSRIAMRVGLLGCKQKGSCSAGFFRINNESSCVNGMINEQFVGESSDGMALLAVDGWTGEEILLKNSTLSTRSSERLMNDAPDNKQLTNDSLNKKTIQNVVHTTFVTQKSAHSCTILEYRWPFVELPSWYVDLREHIEVKGVVIYTAGHGRDGRYLLSSLFGSEEKTKFNSENLERLSIYVESEPRHHDTKTLSRSSSSLCGFVTRINDAIFSPRLHIPCRQPLIGRYVYVEARGVRGRWSQEFAALLCEVMVY
ncbi:putative dock [Schistosoma mansoni]|uniref:putative dock n=1 Tax=Schistosoma mansoni TaxID=6183 RepID=UPI00022DBF1B|nr:putative dock [Schistosoma mansoni]|eukprot:XP_018651917.1 putative dock [Schistosoma mansoni]